MSNMHECFQYCSVSVGPVHKKDVMKASVMLEHDNQLVLIIIYIKIRFERTNNLIIPIPHKVCFATTLGPRLAQQCWFTICWFTAWASFMPCGALLSLIYTNHILINPMFQIL